MQRPIVVAVIGYILGIIWGLYFKFSIALFYGLFFLITVFIKLIKRVILNQNRFNISKKTNLKKKLNIYSLSRYLRYIKLVLNLKTIILIIIVSIISNSIVLFKNQKFNSLYKNIQSIKLVATIEDLKSDGQYKNVYKVKVLEVNDSKKYENTYLYLNINKKYEFKYGTKVIVNGEFNEPNVSRNFGGFNYKEYLKTLNIYGSVDVTKIEIVEEKQKDKYFLGNHLIEFNKFFNDLKDNIYKNSKKYLNNEVSSLFLGIILGDTYTIEESVKEQFQNANMSHILAVSGMHISYIILGSSILFNKIFGKKKSKFIISFILIFYICLAGFSPSILRASLMGIMVLVSGLIHRKNDIWTVISISLLIILIYNPFLITNVGLQLSYVGTLGIILFNKNILKILNKGKANKSKIKEIISVTLSAQIAILPITIFHFNVVGIYFLITNLLLSIIVGPLIIVGFIFLVLSIFNFGIIKFISIFLNVLLKLVLIISNVGFLPFSKIYIATPKLWQILIFYFVFILINFIYFIKHKTNLNASSLRIIYILELLKYKIRKYKSKHNNLVKTVFIFIIIIIVITNLLLVFSYKELRIHFVDVGQGDCCFIETPKNHVILIDGGGSDSKNYDIGKRTLIPYILDRGYTKIDYIFISHFDSDHVGGILSVMEELKVGKIFISKQGEDCDNYKRFRQIVKNKNIKVQIVNKGDNFKIEEDMFFYILWPNNDKMILENILNNNSMVFKMTYKSFSMLFTGDIEEIAEKQILQEYKDNLQLLNSSILKVGHHGSRTSSMQEFVKEVKPQIALIGVGENNKFGHPNSEVLERLEKLDIKLYRTDEMGEISIIVDKKGRMKMKKYIE